MKYISNCADDTEKIAKEIAANLKPGDVISLSGELGAGKTAFVRGIADFFGYEGNVTSPTFTLVNEYDGINMTLYHFDAYRLENANTDQLDWIDDYLFGDGICLIEWAEFISPVLPDNTKFIDISKDIRFGENYREIHVK
ncbi:MAG: tRNA (adenosine(37)-N6)-threonylcarbamoyltransferase complex ATPase subunit type 1 TsaE [Ruminococcaceae bacterium]|nr:tRNA (adenosine(37)-N6)-threonylcarbamoyltransferase complex ATPase subunit type 1 TsaE [Oscillospiraceae bacterium]